MTLIQALISWLVLFAVAFANGAIREFAYTAYLGEHRANQVSCGTGIVLIGAAVWLLSRRWRFQSSAQAWRTGWLWLALTVAWEFLFGLYLRGYPWERVLHEYAIWQGRLWTLVLLAILVLPALVYAADRSHRTAART
jgi:hypothetical protein